MSKVECQYYQYYITYLIIPILFMNPVSLVLLQARH